MFIPFTGVVLTVAVLASCKGNPTHQGLSAPHKGDLPPEDVARVEIAIATGRATGAGGTAGGTAPTASSAATAGVSGTGGAAGGALVAASGSDANDVRYLDAPPALRELWNKWQGKYMLFVHRSAEVRTIEDLHKKPLYVWWGSDDVVHDAVAFDKAGALQMKIGIQNNPAMVKRQFAKDAKQIAFVVPKAAKRFAFLGNTNLVELRIK